MKISHRNRKKAISMIRHGGRRLPFLIAYIERCEERSLRRRMASLRVALAALTAAGTAFQIAAVNLTPIPIGLSEEEKKQLRREKALAITRIGIDGARGLAHAFNFPFNFPLTKVDPTLLTIDPQP